MPRETLLQPRKAPRQARATATVDAILEAAARILERDGLDRYSTNGVARVAGVSVGSLYQYFPSKDALTKALIDRQRASLLVDIEAITIKTDGRSALCELIAIAVFHQLRRPALARLLDLQEQHLPIDAETRQFGARVLGAVQQCLDAPDMRTQNHSLFAKADIVAIVKGMVDAAGERGEDDAEALIGRVRRAVFGYLSLE